MQYLVVDDVVADNEIEIVWILEPTWLHRSCGLERGRGLGMGQQAWRRFLCG
jgi:hypothetical protein